jgi:hypothetical protein
VPAAGTGDVSQDLDVPTTDGTLNIDIRDVIGSKADAAAEATTASIVALVRQMLSDIDTVAGGPNYTKEASVAAADYTSEQTVLTLNTNEEHVIYDSLVINIDVFTATATLTIKVYQKIVGAEEIIDTITRVVGTDDDGVPLLSGWAPHEQLRITIESDNAGDSAVAVPYSGTARNFGGTNDPFA